MTIQVAKVPFQKMTFSPDVPSAALGPNEYNIGLNVETDVRGIRSVAGDQEILDPIPGTPTFVTGGFRGDGKFWFVVATDEGHWWAATTSTTWTDITPSIGTFTGYNQATNITSSWNGTVLLLNDETNPPMFWPEPAIPGTVTPLVMYSDISPISISTLTNTSLTTRTITFASNVSPAPFQVGGQIIVSGVDPSYYNGTFTVQSCSTSSVTYYDTTIGPYNSSGSVANNYTWNFNPYWAGVYAKFMRAYDTPNVGTILLAGNLTATPLTTSTQQVYPVTVQWSQAFGLNQVPTTWTPTVSNVANQLEVPLRGPALDGFPCNGQFFLCSYWDTVVFSPINYQTTSAPILGVRLYNQGRGLLSSNTWAKTDTMVYGVDARDVWSFDGNNFTGIGNQRVKNWFYDQLDPKYYDRVYMQSNTQKMQIEIYYPDNNAINGVPNKMLSYRYDLDCWNAPRDVAGATMSCEAPLYINGTPALSHRSVVYARGVTNSRLVQKDQGFAFVGTNSQINSYFQRDNIKILPNYTSKLLVHRILPEVNNLGTILDQGNDLPIYNSSATISLTLEGANSVGSVPSQTTAVTMFVDSNGNPGQNPWVQFTQNAYRVNTIKISNVSSSSVWLCSGTTWQVSAVEEDR